MDIEKYAQGLGFRIEYEPLSGYDGLLLPGMIILVNSGITFRRQREAIAHELGHDWLGHKLVLDHEDEESELMADRYAARLLISPTEYATAEALFGCDAGAISKELDVSVEYVHLWRTTKALA